MNTSELQELRGMKREETLLEYSDRERHNDPWWQPVYEILLDNAQRLKAAPPGAQPSVTPAVTHRSVVPEAAKNNRSAAGHVFCEVCCTGFTARRGARFCSGKCQVKASRAKKALATRSESNLEASQTRSGSGGNGPNKSYRAVGHILGHLGVCMTYLSEKGGL
jgi:hypothetical protein